MPRKTAAQTRCTMPVTAGRRTAWLTIGAQSRVGVEQRHAGEHQHHGADGETQMGDPPDRRPALDSRRPACPRRWQRRRARTCGRFFALLALSVARGRTTARNASRRRRTRRQQQHHEFRGEPQIGIVLEIVRIAVRLEGDEARGRVGWHFWQVCKPVGREDGRARIVDALDRMVAVAVEALGRIGVAQRVDLAVIGRQVGLQLLLMAGAAVLGDDELGRVRNGFWMSCAVWQSAQIAALGLWFCSTSLPWTDVS